MKVIKARNVNDALVQGFEYLDHYGDPRPSRNGDVIVAPVPVTTVYSNPVERVLFDPVRDANPFFHLAEAFWMLLGRNDLETMTRYVKNMANYSDDGSTLAGAYGHRWRNHFMLDQITWAVNRLKADPNDRRVIISMFDPWEDSEAIKKGGKDIPCNLMVLPAIRDGALDITVYNRSNDMIWGAYGANAVHFSVLQEYLAYRLDLEVGQYWQVSNNFHMYLETAHKVQPFMANYKNPYELGAVDVMPMFTDFDIVEIGECLDGKWYRDYYMPFIVEVARPLLEAHSVYKQLGGLDGVCSAINLLERNGKERNDWVMAGLSWLERRRRKLERQQDDGVSYE